MIKMPRSYSEPAKNYWMRNWDITLLSGINLVSIWIYNFDRVNIQKKEDSNISVLMRIMTNYLQIFAAALAFNLKFPTYMLDSLSSVRQAGQSSGVFLSYDCLLMNTRATEMFDNIAYLKVLCIALIPIVLVASTTLGFRLFFLHNSEKFKRFT